MSFECFLSHVWECWPSLISDDDYSKYFGTSTIYMYMLNMTLIKIGCLVIEEMSIDIFHKGCHGNQSCNVGRKPEPNQRNENSKLGFLDRKQVKPPQ